MPEDLVTPGASDMLEFMSKERPHIIVAESKTFEKEVIERSNDVPVVVDFWAQWCGPCRLLGPVLEKLADEYEGAFVLVKAETDQLPDVAAGFGVRSIPAVFGLRNGKVVDSFVGALPEPAVRIWLERLLPTPAEKLVAEAQRLEPTDPATAETKYREAIALGPTEPSAKIGLARLLLSLGRLDESQSLVADLEGRGFLEPEAERLRAELTLRTQARQSGGIEAARAAVVANPNDRSLQLKLAEALAAGGKYVEALDLCLRLVEEDRKGVGEQARHTMLQIFHLLPEDSQLLSEYRRKLSLVLY